MLMGEPNVGVRVLSLRLLEEVLKHLQYILF
jgi:hypothetical protein